MLERAIQFLHDRAYDEHGDILYPKGGNTIVMEKITFEEFEAATPCLEEPEFRLRVGIARCSKKENYNKKVGRELAKSRMKHYNLFVTCKSNNYIQLYNGDLDVTFILGRNDKTYDINFIDVLFR
jgi:hypothetical protein